MEALGSYVLGIVVGTVAAIGIRFMQADIERWKVGLGIFLASTLSGTAIEFVDSIGSSDGTSNLSAYSIGLLIALAWFFLAEKGVDLKEGRLTVKGFVGWLLLLSTPYLTVVATATVASFGNLRLERWGFVFVRLVP